ncbi:uncharacterized protein LOC100922301 isoform X2 [Sarcophilus harrisii]|uniref:uncharacterized protein LOC100922301 isoform X2 n=1 Tax=Sarcophilus harrisii TaxID=9305 RepID=UPI001301F557|nr:uncharacterized protein LOC100922301 isoform X2 [Sarcophilus harrisii]
MTGVRANVTPVSFFVLLLHCWGGTEPQMLINDSGQNEKQFILKQSLPANEKIAEAIGKARNVEKYASDSPNNLWINQILNNLENHLGKNEGPQEDDLQDKQKDITELIKNFPESIDLDQTHEKQMSFSENSRVNISIIESILQTLKKNSDFHRNIPTSASLLTVLKNIIITCLTVTGLLFALVLLLYIFASLCMKSRPREPPVNNTYNIYITEEMKKNSASLKEIFSEKPKEDPPRMRADSQNLQYTQSPEYIITEPESKLIQNSNFNNRTTFSGDFMKGRIMPLNGFIVPNYGNKSRRSKDFISSSELSDSDAIQTVFLAKPNNYQLHDIPGSQMNMEYIKKKSSINVRMSQQEPDNLGRSQHDLNNPGEKYQYIASSDNAEETQSDIYPSSNTTENSERANNRQINRSAILQNASSPSHSD